MNIAHLPNNNKNTIVYLVNIRHINVAESIINRCDSADCERCIARLRSFYVMIQQRKDSRRRRRGGRKMIIRKLMDELTE